MLRVVITEYPKSGGSWVVSMLGDTLGICKRDIYVKDGYDLFDIWQHPWYEGANDLGLTKSCVIKSHEFPKSSLIAFPAHFVHLVRDGRDLVISKYFYEKYFCVANGIYEKFEVAFDDYLKAIASEWKEYITVWLEHIQYFYRYEDFLRDPFSMIQKLLMSLNISFLEEKIRYAVQNNTKRKFKKSLDKVFQYNTFVRKGTRGDWRHHFGDEHIRAFKEIAGDMLILLGYEKDLDWQ